MTTEVELVNTITSIIARLTFTVKSFDHIEGTVPINYTLSTFRDTVEFKDIVSENIVFNAENQVKILCHDFNTTDGVKWYDYMTKEYLKRGKTNVFAMHYQVPDKEMPEIEQAAYIRHLAKKLGDFLVELNAFYGVKLDNVHILGHKRGAHIAGVAGRLALEKSKESVGRITALDPNYMMYLSWNTTEKIRGQDAKFIDAIHVSPSSYYIGRNMTSFLVGGYRSKCDYQELRKVTDAAPKVFSTTINGKQMKVYKCSNNTWGKRCQKSFAVMGDMVDTKINGTYYLDEKEDICKILDIKETNQLKNDMK